MGRNEMPPQGDPLSEMIDPVIEGAANEAADKMGMVQKAPEKAMGAVADTVEDEIAAARAKIEGANEEEETE